MKERPFTDIAYSTSDRVVVHGFDLCEDLMPAINLGDMVMVQMQQRLPTPEESRVLNAVLVAIVDHGLTPSTIAARMVLHAAPEAVQGAVGAGLLAAGSRLLGTMENCGQMLQSVLADHEGDDVSAVAERVVRQKRAASERIPGLGHPIHTDYDPRTRALRRIAAEQGLVKRHIQLIEAIADVQGAMGKQLPLNAAGMGAAVLSDLGFHHSQMRGLILIARCIGVVAHIEEEQKRGIGGDLWKLAEDTYSRGHQ